MAKHKGDEAPKSRPGLKLTRRKLILAAFLIPVLALAYFIHVVNSPSEGIIKVSKTESPIVQTGSQSYLSLSNHYFDFLYPGEYPLKQIPAGLIAYQAAGKLQNQVGSGTLSIELRPAPDGGITADSEYKAYQAQPKVYSWSQKFYGSEIVDIASRRSGGEENALWLHGKYLLAVNFHAQLPAKDLDQIVKDILSSVKWKNV